MNTGPVCWSCGAVESDEGRSAAWHRRLGRGGGSDGGHSRQTCRGAYLLGENFTAVDVLFGTSFALFAQAEFMPKSPLIGAYVQRIVTRPAFARGMARDAG
jgi:glutathione S-transferase